MTDMTEIIEKAREAPPAKRPAWITMTCPDCGHSERTPNWGQTPVQPCDTCELQAALKEEG